MSGRLVVTLTVEDLESLVEGAVTKAIAARDTVDRLSRDLAAEELTVQDLVTLFKLAPKNGPKTIWAWRKERGFPAPYRRGGNRVRWIRAEVDAWRAEQGTSGPGAATEPQPRSARRRREGRAATAAH
jgi:hypothetical protein